jgi:hypothetical protein
MKEKHINGLVKMINLYGLVKTSEMTGLSIYELAIKTNFKLDLDTYPIILKSLSKNKLIPSTYKDFTINIDALSGIYEWWCYIYDGNGEKYYIEAMATPFWDDYGIPVEIISIDSSEIDDDNFSYIKVDDKIETVDELIRWYNEFYLPKTYEKIVTLFSDLLETGYYN